MKLAIILKSWLRGRAELPSDGSLYLIRKINQSKWAENSSFTKKEVPADTVFAELKTKNNMLSFWQFSLGAEELWKEAALAVGANFDRADSFDIVWIEHEHFRVVGLSLKDSRGDTPIVDLQHFHYDVIDIDSSRLSTIAGLLAYTIRSKKQVRRIIKSELLNLLAEAVQTDRLRLESLKPSLKDEVKNKLII